MLVMDYLQLFTAAIASDFCHPRRAESLGEDRRKIQWPTTGWDEYLLKRQKVKTKVDSNTVMV